MLRQVLRTTTTKQCFRASFSSQADINASLLTINKTKNPKAKTAKETLVFGATQSDHMLEFDWTADDGWAAPHISEYQPLAMNPSSSCLHYGLECFEGMKAYLDSKDRIRLFRPMKNMERMNSSMRRLVMPEFDGEQYVECMKELLKLDKSWIPKGDGYSLYIRPTSVSTQASLGVSISQSVKSFVVTSPVGPYYPTGFAAVRLLADPSFVRAWPGGTGAIKCGGNYAMGMQAQRMAMDRGYSQVLWLFKDQVTEAGTMNQMFFWKRKDGTPELITAPLDGTILPGVTRDSILTLARAYGDFEVTERDYTIYEVIEAIEEGRLIEGFGCGTAAVVSPVKEFHYDGKDYPVPLDPSDSDSQIGPLAKRFYDDLLDIQYGRKEFEDWSVVVD